MTEPRPAYALKTTRGVGRRIPAGFQICRSTTGNDLRSPGLLMERNLARNHVLALGVRWALSHHQNGDCNYLIIRRNSEQNFATCHDFQYAVNKIWHFSSAPLRRSSFWQRFDQRVLAGVRQRVDASKKRHLASIRNPRDVGARLRTIV